MLDSLGKTVTSKPWIVVLVVIIITVGFSTLLPTLEMNTSMDDFLPDDEVVLADERIQDYFGASNEIIMVLAEGEEKNRVLSSEGLQSLYQVSETLTKFDAVDDVMSIAGFVDIVCGLEYNKSLDECTNEEILSVYHDLMTNPSYETIRIYHVDDENEDVDFQRFKRFSKKSAIDTIDVKNLNIQQNETHITFSILLYDISDIESMLLSRGLNVNVIEWFVSFQNIIGPSTLQEMQYRLSARLEPKEELWEIRNGLFPNINHIIQLVKNRDLLKSYTFNTYLWITPPGTDTSFPIPLRSGDINWDDDNTAISISVSREELGENGFGFETSSFGMPARMGNLYCGVRTYQFPLFNMPWKRYTLSMNATENLIQFIQKRPILGNLGERILSNRAGMSWDDVNDMFEMMNDQMSEMDALSLTQMDQLYVETDRAPDTGFMTETVFFKPSFLTGLKDSAINFISSDYHFETGASSVLLMVNINGSIDPSDIESISKDVIDALEEKNDEIDTIHFQATGNSIVENEINEVSMEANSFIIPMIFVVISIILLISFRKLSYVILPLAGLSFAIIWMFGTMVVLQMPFMVMEVALIPMLMGLGVDYSVHLYHNYRVEKGKGRDAKIAMEKSIQGIGVAMLLATITTFIAFLSFLTATMIPLRDFGVLCAVGIAYVFAITITFQAAMRFILDRRTDKKNQTKKIEPKKQEYGKIMRKIARVVCNHPVPILVITVMITGVMGYGAMQIETGFAMEDFLPEENPSVVVMTTILDEFPFASQEKEYILIGQENIAQVSVLEDIHKVIQNCKDDSFVMFSRDGIPKTGSVLSVMQDAMKTNTSLVPRFSLNNNGIPSSDSMVEDFFDYLYDHENFGYEMQTYLHQSKTHRYDATVVHVYTNVNGDGGDDVSNVMKDLYEGLNDNTDGLFDEATVTVTGENSMMYVIMNSMTESQLISTAICLVLAAIVLIIAYRNPVLGIITMMPVSISTLWIVGAMYFIGYSLNVMTIMITSLTIGLGITYAIHAVERFRLYANNTGDVIGAVAETVGHTGGALLISAVTTMFGFGMLIFTPMPVEQQFGIITALTIAFAFLTSIFILPPVLLFWGKWRKKHRGYIISKGDPNHKKH